MGAGKQQKVLISPKRRHLAARPPRTLASD